jgi:Mce-associated membrane protein
VSDDNDAGVEIDDGHHDSVAPPRRRSALTSWLVSAALVALLAASVAFAVKTWGDHRADVASDKDRSAALSVAQQFTLRLDDISYKDLTGYGKSVAPLLTPKMQTDFKSSFTSFDAAFKAIQLTSKGTVQAAGVQDIDQDSATVLVIHDVNVTSKGCVQPPYKRMKVDLRKINGTWLVDNFEEGVPGCQG